MKKIFLLLVLISLTVNVKANEKEDYLESISSKLETIQSDTFLNGHPVGSIYKTVNSDENTTAKMASKYGGTWRLFGDGKVIRGTTASSMTSGGSSSVTLNYTNIPTLGISGTTNSTGSGYTLNYNTTGTNNATTTAAGSHNHIVGNWASREAGGYGLEVGAGGFNGRIMVTSSSGTITSSSVSNYEHTYTNRYLTGLSGVASHLHSFSATYSNSSVSSISVVDQYITVYMFERIG